jgi:uncharacterized cupin superfamily protein
MTAMQKTAARPDFDVVTRYDVSASEPKLEAWPAFPPEDILAGNPAHRGAVLYRDPTRLFSLGIWECPPGKFRVEYAGTESGHVVKGSATLTDAKTGASQTIKTGDRFLVPFASTIIWEVHEPFRKVYTMYEDKWIDERYY